MIKLSLALNSLAIYEQVTTKTETASGVGDVGLGVPPPKQKFRFGKYTSKSFTDQTFQNLF